MRVIVLLVLLLLANCARGEWTYRETNVERVKCPGGTVNEERRTTEVHLGRTRNVVVRTDACFE